MANRVPSRPDTTLDGFVVQDSRIGCIASNKLLFYKQKVSKMPLIFSVITFVNDIPKGPSCLYEKIVRKRIMGKK